MVGGLYLWGEESQAERVGANPGTLTTAEIAKAVGTKRKSLWSGHPSFSRSYAAMLMVFLTLQ